MTRTEQCVFCEIVAGECEQEIVAANDDVLAFLCEPPATWGHTLIVPRAHRRDIWTVEPEEAAASIELARRLARVMRDELGRSASTFARTPASARARTSSTFTCTSSRATWTTRSSRAACGALRPGGRRKAATPSAGGSPRPSARASTPRILSVATLTGISPLLLVGELDRAVAFYRDRLGFECELSATR